MISLNIKIPHLQIAPLVGILEVGNLEGILTTDIAIAKYMYLINLMVNILPLYTFRKPFSGEI